MYDDRLYWHESIGINDNAKHFFQPFALYLQGAISSGNAFNVKLVIDFMQKIINHAYVSGELEPVSCCVADQSSIRLKSMFMYGAQDAASANITSKYIICTTEGVTHKNTQPAYKILTKKKDLMRGAHIYSVKETHCCLRATFI